MSPAPSFLWGNPRRRGGRGRRRVPFPASPGVGIEPRYGGSPLKHSLALRPWVPPRPPLPCIPRGRGSRHVSRRSGHPPKPITSPYPSGGGTATSLLPRHHPPVSHPPTHPRCIRLQGAPRDARRLPAPQSIPVQEPPPPLLRTGSSPRRRRSLFALSPHPVAAGGTAGRGAQVAAEPAPPRAAPHRAEQRRSPPPAPCRVPWRLGPNCLLKTSS